MVNISEALVSRPLMLKLLQLGGASEKDLTQDPVADATLRDT